jgi:hypothetical protein
MSLVDALLLDPYPFEIWIAYRTDEAKGTGTLNDPLNGVTRYEASKALTDLTRSGLAATATTTVAHNYSTETW